jgi:hypothetical protein
LGSRREGFQRRKVIYHWVSRLFKVVAESSVMPLRSSPYSCTRGANREAMQRETIMDDWDLLGYQPYSSDDLDLVIQKAMALCAVLKPEDQISFLDLLVRAPDPVVKGELVERALIGERVWKTIRHPRRLAG